MGVEKYKILSNTEFSVSLPILLGFIDYCGELGLMVLISGLQCGDSALWSNYMEMGHWTRVTAWLYGYLQYSLLSMVILSIYVGSISINLTSITNKGK